MLGSGVRKRVVSKRVVLADVPPERKPERGYVRQNHPFRKPPFYLPVIGGSAVPNTFALGMWLALERKGRIPRIK